MNQPDQNHVELTIEPARLRLRSAGKGKRDAP